MQRDDERYPIPVHTTAEANLPEVAAHPQAAEYFQNSQEKYSLPGTTPSPYKDANASPFTPAVAEGGGADLAPGLEVVTKPERKTVCGLRRRTFWALVAVALVLIIVGAVVGGVLGSRKATSSNSDTPAPSSTASPLDPSTPLPASRRSVAAGSSVGDDATAATLQILYQDLATTRVLYRLMWDDKIKVEKVASLRIPPNQGTPLAATSMRSSSSAGVVVDLFYLSTDNSTILPMICQATLECSKGAGACSTTYNEVIAKEAISTTIQKGVSADSALAAVLMEDTAEFRVFFQGGGGAVWCLVGHGRPDAGSWTLMPLEAPAVTRSALSASAKRKTGEIDLLFVSKLSSKLREVLYTDKIGPGKSRKDIDGTPGSVWDVGARHAACYLPGTDTWYAFFVGPSGGEIIGYSKKAGADNWGQGFGNKKWGLSEGAISTLCWGDQIRLVYMRSGRLSMAASDNGTWADPQDF